jgi:7-cyano-7-deazaguanine synthase
MEKTNAGAVLLLSGGMDSATCLWWMKRELAGPVHALSVDYGQRHRVELECAARLAQVAGVPHKVVGLDLGAIGGSPLTDLALEVPSGQEDRQLATVVPFRNLLFAALAAAWAETLGLAAVYLAPVKDDYRSYRDCRRPFYDHLEKTLSLGSTREGGWTLHTPFVDQWKTEVVKLGLELGVPYELTHTCYEGRRPACGQCDACAERLAAFAANGVPDPLEYVPRC